jgi:hypothetical protein
MPDGETNTLATCGLEEPFFQLCCCVSVLFWREIGFGLQTTYVLRVPYSRGVVLGFLVVVGNSFWCFNVLSVQDSCVAGKLILYKFSC